MKNLLLTLAFLLIPLTATYATPAEATFFDAFIDAQKALSVESKSELKLIIREEKTIMDATLEVYENIYLWLNSLRKNNGNPLDK